MRCLDYNTVRDALITFVRESVEKTGVEGVVIGISGGIDSATTAYLAARALGKEKVLGLIMPYYENRDVEDARLVCNSLGIECKLVNIRPVVDSLVFLKL
jgi:NAD+ synthase